MVYTPYSVSPTAYVNVAEQQTFMPVAIKHETSSVFDLVWFVPMFVPKIAIA